MSHLSMLWRNLNISKLREALIKIEVRNVIRKAAKVVAVELVPEYRNCKCVFDREHGGKSEGEDDQCPKFPPLRMFGYVSAAFSLNFFGRPEEPQETPEEKLINTIKRAILSIQREDYDVAERMLHLALRMAQDLNSSEGITYVYDVMANLAMEREQFRKAEKLFADVTKRLFQKGLAEDSPQILHISSKLAHMAQLQGEFEKAMQGFTWTLKRIEDNMRKVPDDKDIQELQGLTKNWFGQLLVKLGKYADAKIYFREAYECLVVIYGRVNQEAITILNNLSVACVNLDDYSEAKKYLLEALDLVKELDDTAQEGILLANLGLIYLREGLVSEAKKACSHAWRAAKKQKNEGTIEQAEYCLNEIKVYIKEKK